MHIKSRLYKFHNEIDCCAFDFFGCHKLSENEYIFRVWAPHADSVSLIGSFNGWNEELGRMHRLEDSESFEIAVAAKEGDAYKFCITTFDGRKLYKADPYAVSSDLPHSTASKIASLPDGCCNAEGGGQDDPINIYEVNLLSWKREKDNSYFTFEKLKKTLVPYVKSMGYTHVEFMPITEFPFDGSWGYQVTGYYSVTSRLGTPVQFRELIDAFHANGIKVILDWVPAHFPKDEWGLYEFDGQPLYEYALWDKMELTGWGTRRFDFSRREVVNFLLSSAVFLFKMFGIDGMRVDAVASMLYLDYDRAAGDYTQNIFGDNRNIEAIEFLKTLNKTVKEIFPHALMIAEESTVFPSVTGAVECGGLGFDYKWNLGWMNDVLFYCRQDPYFRNYHHNKITFSLVYAFSENYILPLSHDEVVHVKGSIVNKIFGEYDDKFSGERALLGYMYAHPGKKLNFMGYEIAQFKEWDYRSAIEYHLQKFEKHRKMRTFVKALNMFYRSHNALYEIDGSWDGFEWLVVDDKSSNLLAFRRFAKNREFITCIVNFSGIDLLKYEIRLPQGKYRVVMNTDSPVFGGSGKIKKRIYKSVKKSSLDSEGSVFVDVAKLSCIYLEKVK